uniref:Uncharacterized protein n=1 Tax=Arundo donax TaxID=35708 RepID=A0A0A8ZH40_ARUDO
MSIQSVMFSHCMESQSYIFQFSSTYFVSMLYCCYYILKSFFD